MDPIKEAATIISGSPDEALERRLKRDIIASIGRVKPALVKDLDFERDVMSGSVFSTFEAPIQGIAIAKVEGALAFYNRVGWRAEYLTEPLSTCVPAEGIEVLENRYHAKTLHDLSYVHPRHFEKMLGKTEAASLWETLKRYSAMAVN